MLYHFCKNCNSFGSGIYIIVLIFFNIYYHCSLFILIFIILLKYAIGNVSLRKEMYSDIYVIIIDFIWIHCMLSHTKKYMKQVKKCDYCDS